MSTPSYADPRSATYATDGGGLISSAPDRILLPRNVEDVEALVGAARRDGTRLTVRGGGKTTEGESLAAAGETLVGLRGLNRILEIDDDTVWVEGGATFEELESALLARGLTVTSAPLNLSATIGGTIGVGGIDVNSYSRMCVADQVIELEVVTPAGDVVRCSPSVESDLFERMIYGYGQFGIATKIRLPVRRHRPVRLETLYYNSVGAAVADLRRVWDAGSGADMTGVLSLRDDVAALLIGYEVDGDDRRHEELSATLSGSGELGLLGAKFLDFLRDPMLLARTPWLLSSRQRILRGLEDPLHRDADGFISNRLAVFGRLIWGYWGRKPIVIPDIAVTCDKIDRAVVAGNLLTKERFDQYTLYIVGVAKQPWRRAYDLGPFPKCDDTLVCGVEYEPLLHGRFWTAEMVQEFKDAIYGLGRQLEGRAYRFGGLMKHHVEGFCGAGAWQRFVEAKKQADPGGLLNPRVLL